jgi:copper amine oxidase-like protein
MKRFLSIFAILAMVVSMFSGVAFADAADDALAKIDNYAADSTKNPAPTAADYRAAGVTDVVADNLNGYNYQVDQVGSGEADTKVKVQVFIDTVNSGVDAIKGYADTDNAGALTLADLVAIGVLRTDFGKTGAELDQYKANVVAKDANQADTVVEIQAIIDEVNEPVAIAYVKGLAGKDASGLRALDLECAGATNVIAAKLTRYKSSVNLTKKSDGSENPDLLDSKEEIQTMVDNMNQDLKIVLDNHDNINYTKGFGTYAITGKILNADGALVKVSPEINIVEDGMAASSKLDGLLNTQEIDAKTAAKPKEAGFIDSKSATGGAFSITINTNNYGQFLVYGKTSRTAYFENSDTAPVVVKHDVYRVLPAVELGEPEEFCFAFPVDGSPRISGFFTNEDAHFTTAGGLTESDLQIGYVNEYDMLIGTTAPAVEEADYTDASSFGFLFKGKELFTRTGDIGIFYKGVLLIKGEVTVGELTASLSTDEVPRALGRQEFSVDFDLSTDYAEENATNTNKDYCLRMLLKDPDGNYKVLTGTQVKEPGDAGKLVDAKITERVASKSDNQVAEIVQSTDATKKLKFTDAEDQKVTVSLNVTDAWDTGNYELIFQLYNTTAKVIKEKKFDFTVKNPSAYTLIGWDDSKFKVGTVRIELPNNPSTSSIPNYVGGENVIQKIAVKKYSSSTISHIKYFEVDVKGCGIDETLTNLTSTDQDFSKKLAVSETGVMDITIRAYKAVDEAPVATFTREITMTGWNIEVTPNVLTVDSNEDVTFTITDEEGNPVNNAVIKTKDGTKTLVDGTKTNIVGGVYTYEDDEEDLFETVGDVNLVFIKDGVKQVELDGGIEVTGKEVYTVSSDTDVLLNGQKESVYVSVLDEDGNIVYPSFTRIDVSASGKQSKALAADITVSGTRKDLDGDGVKESVKITVTPNKNQVAMILRATTDNGKKKGEVKIEVQTPQLVMTGVNTLTENFKNNLKFQIIDPRDNSIINEEVYLVADKTQVLFKVTTADKSEIQVTDGKSISFGSEEDKFDYVVFVDDVNWKKLEKDEDDAVIKVMMDLGDVDDKDVKLMEIPIANAKLTSNPETIIMNSATNITLTYVDAEGNALEGYVLNLGDDEIGETDENGQYTYSTAATSSVALTFKGATDDSEKTSSNPIENTGDLKEEDGTVTVLKVKAGADVQAPTATFELTGKNTAIITITDNVRIAKAMVNGELVDMFFPMPTATHVVTGLKVGENKVQVLAGDINNNFLQTELVITIEKTAEPVSFKLNEETEFGTPVKVDGVTMVPVRFAEKLGATVDWNAETETVTYTTGEKTIAMTIGSKTAVVNGENVQLKNAAYKNELGRTMVPVRMIATELGFTVNYVSDDAPITIE